MKEIVRVVEKVISSINNMENPKDLTDVEINNIRKVKNYIEEEKVCQEDDILLEKLYEILDWEGGIYNFDRLIDALNWVIEESSYTE